MRAGVGPDSLGLVAAGMDTVKVYRSRDIEATSYGESHTRKEFYLAVEIHGHRGLVRDLAWAPGNIRGHDLIATACQDGHVRVFRIETPFSDDDGKSWSEADLLRHSSGYSAKTKNKPNGSNSNNNNNNNINNSNSNNNNNSNSNNITNDGNAPNSKDDIAPSSSNEKQLHQQQHHHHQSQHHHHHHHSSSLSASLAKSGGTHVDRHWSGQPGQVKHTLKEVSKLESHHTPVWRVGFDDDGQVLGSTGDDGRLLCFRQLPDGSWAKSSEVMMLKTRGLAPSG